MNQTSNLRVKLKVSDEMLSKVFPTVIMTIGCGPDVTIATQSSTEKNNITFRGEVLCVRKPPLM